MSDDTDIMPGYPRLPVPRDSRFPYLGHGTPIAGHGCICPPGAEATCKGPLCPRRPMGSAGEVR